MKTELIGIEQMIADLRGMDVGPRAHLLISFQINAVLHGLSLAIEDLQSDGDIPSANTFEQINRLELLHDKIKKEGLKKCS